MPTFRSSFAGVVATCAALVVASTATAQVRRDSVADTVRRGSVTVVPSASYTRGPLGRAILGSGWRDIWATPVRAPLLNIDTFAGGLRIDKQGGGFQTVTLHFTEQNGWREYRFRSVDKFPMQRLPAALAGTIVGGVIQDQMGNLFPGAPILVPPFIAAVGGLHVEPKLVVMQDNPRLGEYRSFFSGMLGTMELKGEEAPDDKPGFAGSDKIKDTDKFFDDLYESQAHRVNEREFLAIRLVDFLINDTDRTPDNLDWARFGTKSTGYLWRPIARDRDRAFTNGGGWLNTLIVQQVYPKFTVFNDRYAMRGLIQSSYIFDRRLLQRLTSSDFAQIAREVQTAISDDVIDAAIRNLPAEWRGLESVGELRSTLIARRAGLADFAMRFYAELAGYPDIILTGDDERAEIVRHADGRVTVTVPSVMNQRVIASAEVPNATGGATRVMNGALETRGNPALFYERTFLPGETKEIRVYLGKGNDAAVIRGAANDEITLRVIGEGGNDILADSAGSGSTYFYDSEGTNQFVTKGGTHTDVRTWNAPAPEFGFRLSPAWKPDWGYRQGWSPTARYFEGAGLAIGLGPRWKAYGFRRLPYHWDAGVTGFVGTGNGKFAITADADWRAENSPLALTLDARASQLEAFRFFGYGNDTPNIGRELSLVEQKVMSVEPAIVWRVGWRAREAGTDLIGLDTTTSRLRSTEGKVRFGPVLSWTDPDPVAGSPLLSSATGGDQFTYAGLRARMELDKTDDDAVPTMGWRLRTDLAAYPALMDLDDAFATAAVRASTYVPLGFAGSSMAFRVGGGISSGGMSNLVAAQFAPSIGGSSSLRGYRSRRFTGDAASNAAAEVRLPLGQVNFLVRSDVGVFALGDVGRVWYDGRSDGAWHTGVGGGIWAAALGGAVSFTYAHGEQHRFYLKAGLPF